MTSRLVSLRARAILGAALVFQLTVGAPGISPAEVVRDPLWVTNGEVRAVASTDNTIFIGGEFTKVGPATGSFATFDAASGNSVPPFAGVVGTVEAIAPDGSGGYYLGGSFNGVKGQSRNGLAHVDASGATLSWNPDVTGTVNALAVVGSTVYIGGSFTQVGGQPRSNLAAVDAATGAPLAWTPDPNGAVKALASNGTRLFVGGSFHSMAGTTRNLTGSFNVASGALETWAPIAAPSGGSVETMVIYGSYLYVGGSFTVIGGQSRSNLAALDLGTGAASSWNPNVSGTVLALAITQINSLPTPIPTFWIGGDFSQVGGVARLRLAAVDDNGAVQSFNPGANGPVRAMQIRTNGAGFVSSFFVGGDFTVVAGASRPYVASLTSSGTSNPWTPVPTGPVHALAFGSGTIVAGGAFYSANMTTRVNLAALDAISGSVTAFNPGVNGPVYALLLHDRKLLVGGQFSLIATSARTGAAEIDIDTYFVSAYDPQLDCADFSCGGPIVYAIARAENTKTVYLGGSFSGASALPRRNIVATDGSTGAPTPFNVNANAPVRALVIRQDPIVLYFRLSLYAGGDFTRVNDGLFNAPPGGSIRYGLVALNPLTGEAAGDWNPAPSTTFSVNTLAFTATGPTDPGIVWIGGFFSSMGGQSRTNLAAVGGFSGAATAWNPFASSTVRAMLLGPTGIILGGDFVLMGGQPRHHLACVDSSAGAVTPWDPDASGSVLAIARSGGTVFAGGKFDLVSGYAHPYFAGIGDGVVTAVEPTRTTPPAIHSMSAAPNPFGSHTVAQFTLPRGGDTRVVVYDVAGRLVRTLHRGVLDPGVHTVEWNGSDAAERTVGSGIYFIRVDAPSVRESTKVFHLR